MFPSMPQDDSWDSDVSREIPHSGARRPASGFFGGPVDEHPSGGRKPKRRSGGESADDEEEFDEVEVVPVRRQLSLAIAGFAGLLGAALVLGAQTSAPDSRLSYAIVLFGVQVLYLLALSMAMRPPATAVTAGICAVVALVADHRAVTGTPGLLPLFVIAAGGFAVALVGQLFRAVDRARIGDTWRSTAAIVLGVVAYAVPVVLTRQEVGTQTLVVCTAAAGVTLLVARATDAVLPTPRIAAQVPRGVTGVVLGAMLGTLAAAGLGSVLVLPFDPAKGAVVGVIAAVVANLVDLAVNFGEAGRRLAGDTPTFWVARHMQGPLGAFALTIPVAYALAHWYLS